MIRRRTIILLIVIIIPGLFIIFTLNRSPFGGKNTSLAAPPNKEITRITLSDGVKSLVLSKRKDTWFIDGRTEARKTSINYITRILREMTIKSPVSEEIFNKEIKEPGVSPVRVRAYEDRHLLCDFFVYKTTSNVYGNIMKKSSRSRPFIFYVPGHDNDIGSVFTVNELYWQPYTIFNFMPSEISSVAFENLSDTSNSFVIRKEKRRCELTDGYNIIQSDSSQVLRYLSYFTFIPFEAWDLELDDDKKNEIVNTRPLYRVSVSPVAGKTVRVTLWRRYNEKGETDSDRLYGKTDASDAIFTVRYFDMDPILKKREYFIRK